MASPGEAAYVPPPAEHVGRLMQDLVRFTNASTLDPVTLAAVVHAQFETIHPTETETAGWAACSSVGHWRGGPGSPCRRR